MYDVVRRGNIVESFPDFQLAWLYVYLELDSFAWVIGPDGYWSINPGQHHIN